MAAYYIYTTLFFLACIGVVLIYLHQKNSELTKLQSLMLQQQLSFQEEYRTNLTVAEVTKKAEWCHFNVSQTVNFDKVLNALMPIPGIINSEHQRLFSELLNFYGAQQNSYDAQQQRRKIDDLHTIVSMELGCGRAGYNWLASEMRRNANRLPTNAPYHFRMVNKNRDSLAERRFFRTSRMLKSTIFASPYKPGIIRKTRS